jgi:hypothetical protein
MDELFRRISERLATSQRLTRLRQVAGTIGDGTVRLGECVVEAYLQDFAAEVVETNDSPSFRLRGDKCAIDVRTLALYHIGSVDLYGAVAELQSLGVGGRFADHSGDCRFIVLAADEITERLYLADARAR